MRDLQCVVHGDDFTFCGLENDLDWITELIKTWFEMKVRATLGPDDEDDKKVIILERTLRWKTWGIEWEADPKHRRVVLEYFGLKEDHSDGLSYNGDMDRKDDADYEREEVDKYEAKVFRGLVARINFLSQDCPKLQ